MNKKIKVLITGSSGMVGSNIAKVFESKNIYALELANSKNLNLLDPIQTMKKLQDIAPDYVIHCAGIVGGIQMNINSQFKSLRDNAQMSLNLVNALDKQKKYTRLLNLGSSCIYPKDLDKEYSINDLLTGKLEPTNEGYAIAKILGIKLLEHYNGKSFIGKSIIPCNLFGEYDSFDLESSHLIPAIISKVNSSKATGKPIEIWGDGKARREFSYAMNLALFTLNFLDNFDNFPDKVNFGEEEDHTIQDYYEMVCEVAGLTKNFYYDSNKPVGMKSKKVDISFQKEIGWSNPFTVQEGIVKTYKYYLREYA